MLAATNMDPFHLVLLFLLILIVLVHVWISQLNIYVFCELECNLLYPQWDLPWIYIVYCLWNQWQTPHTFQHQLQNLSMWLLHTLAHISAVDKFHGNCCVYFKENLMETMCNYVLLLLWWALVAINSKSKYI